MAPILKKELEKIGYDVWLPQLPDTDNPDIKKWLPFALENRKYDQDSVLIGHSAGNPLILSILENLEVKVKLAILVAAFSEPNDLDIEKEPILQDKYNWNKINNNCEHTIIINSDNDPWGCNDVAGLKIFKKLGGDLIIRHRQGHMGSDAFKQPYKKFPLLVSLVRSFE